MRFFLFLIVFIISSVAVTAVGISPPSHTVDFTPGGREEFSFHVVNKEGSELRARVSLLGSFSEYASLSDKAFVIPPHGKERFSVTLRFPDEPDKPGKHKLQVQVLEEIPDSGGMSARAGVRGLIVIHVPFPGQYAQLRSFTVAGGSGGVNEGEQASASFSIINRGKEALLDTSAKVVVRDLEGEIVDENSFGDIDIQPTATYDKEFFLDTEDLPASDYNASFNYDYGPRTLSRSVMFRVGNFDVSLTNHSSRLLKRGIVPFEFDVRNLWKGSMAVEASLDVPGAPTAESSRTRFNEFSRKRMQVFLDTSELELGKLNGTLTLYVEKLEEAGGDLSIEKVVPVSFELAEEPVEESPGVLSGMPMVYVVLVALVLLLGVNGFFLTRAFKHRRH